ncbi:polysaccharide pyruvyl transferase CsaB [Bacillus cereus]|nr:polysaccharide pyruvyl transferase CsaB [Bacillus cereus]HDR8327632.1 polysaccharide pyruvyl transferase CsaB [Bacillus cereus]HDR8334341.1 polysaccharide pyruvyl transferase CsaB [Bacillus cereus]
MKDQFKKRIVVSGYYGFDNAGDEAVLYSIIQSLIKRNIEPIVLSAAPSKTEQTYGVKAVPRFSIPSVWEAIKNSDGLISGGGSLLQDTTSAQSSLYYLAIIKMAQLNKKPTFIYSQGMGPLNRNWLRKVTARILNKSTFLSVRDTGSQKLLKDIGVKKDVYVSVDPVLGVGMQERLYDGVWKDKPIVVSVRDWKHDEWKRSLVQVLNHFIKKGKPIVFLPFHTPHDVEVSKELANQLNNKELVHVIEEDLSVLKAVQMIKSASCVIGMRLHALIFAASQHTPFVGISYDPKIDAFLGWFEQPVIATTENLQTELMIAEIEKRISKEIDYRMQISSIHKSLEEVLQYPSNHIADFLGIQEERK